MTSDPPATSSHDRPPDGSVAPVVPDPFAIDELARRAYDLALDYAEAFGARRAYLVVDVHQAPADVYHGLPFSPVVHKGEDGAVHAWRVVTSADRDHSTVSVDVWCADGDSCPDRAVAEQQP